MVNSARPLWRRTSRSTTGPPRTSRSVARATGGHAVGRVLEGPRCVSGGRDRHWPADLAAAGSGSARRDRPRRHGRSARARPQRWIVIALILAIGATAVVVMAGDVLGIRVLSPDRFRLGLALVAVVAAWDPPDAAVLQPPAPPRRRPGSSPRRHRRGVAALLRTGAHAHSGRRDRRPDGHGLGPPVTLHDLRVPLRAGWGMGSGGNRETVFLLHLPAARRRSQRRDHDAGAPEPLDTDAMVPYYVHITSLLAALGSVSSPGWAMPRLVRCRAGSVVAVVARWRSWHPSCWREPCSWDRSRPSTTWASATSFSQLPSERERGSSWACGCPAPRAASS